MRQLTQRQLIEPVKEPLKAELRRLYDTLERVARYSSNDISLGSAAREADVLGALVTRYAAKARELDAEEKPT